MKNVNLYVDVDLTLIDHRGVPLPQAADALRYLHQAGCNIYFWSTGGTDHCCRTADLLGVTDIVIACLPKPDIYIDDMPSTIFNSLLFDVNQEASWMDLAEKIARDCVHPNERRKKSD